MAIGRGLQGAAAALLLSNAVALLAVVFPPRHLAGPMGVYLAGFALGQVGGPLVGGIVASTFGWQWMFWGNVPLALLALGIGAHALRRVPATQVRRPQVDVPGSLVLGVFLAGTQLLLTISAGVGLGDPRIIGALMACLVLLPVLVWVERRVRRPVFAPELFADPAFPVGLLQGFLVLLPRWGVLTIASLYFQGIGGDSVIVASFKAVPFAAGMTVGSLIAAQVARPLGQQGTLTASGVFATLGMVWLWLNVSWDSDAATMAALAVVGLGSGVFQTLNFSAITSSAPASAIGLVNSIRVMVSTFTGGLGLAVVMAVIVMYLPGEVARGFLAGDAAGVGDHRGPIDRGYQAAYAVLTVLMVIGTLTTLLRPRGREPMEGDRADA